MRRSEIAIHYRLNSVERRAVEDVRHVTDEMRTGGHSDLIPNVNGIDQRSVNAGSQLSFWRYCRDGYKEACQAPQLRSG